MTVFRIVQDNCAKLIAMTFNRRFFTSFIVFFILNIFSIELTQAQNALKFPPKPAKESYIVDQANLINTNDTQFINNAAFELLKSESIPIIVVTISSLVSMNAADLTIESYAQKLYYHWGIGYESRNYGILLLVSVGDQIARIELGKDYKGKFNDQTDYIMNSLMLPQFKDKNYSNGIREGVAALDKMARGLALPKPKNPWWLIPGIILGVILIIAITISLFSSGRAGWAWTFLTVVGFGLFYIIRTIMKTKGGSGRSFGGGSSGGGGSTGKW